MERTIALLSGNHLCHNPRIIKEASTLAGAGCRVVILGAWVDPALKARDQAIMQSLPIVFTPVADYGSLHHRSWARRMVNRASGKAVRVTQGMLGIESGQGLGPATGALSAAAHRMSADLYIAHSESGMFVARDLLRAGRRVGVDMEDWYSEDLLPEARKRRPEGLLRELEMELLRHGAHASCPSQAMSEALSAQLGCVPPTVIYNAFPWADRNGLDGSLKDRRGPTIPSIHWYSQTLGEGRGLEDLLAALTHVTRKVEVHLRGQPASGFDGWLADRMPLEWRDRVFVHGLVPNDELLSRIAEHDIGFAGEMKYSRSRDLTVTNKMLHYLLAGLAVVASDTSGQQEVARQAPDAVFLYPSGDAAALATQLNVLLASPQTLGRAKAAALDAAEQTFCWERQAGRLLESVGRAVSAPAHEMRAR